VGALHRYTGLSETYIRRAKLRIDCSRFMRELLRDRGLVVARLDSRYAGTEPDDVGDVPTRDPFNPAIGPAFVACFHDYLDELGVKMDRDYDVMNMQAASSWRRPHGRVTLFSGFMDVMPVLESAMAQNPDLRVLVACGVYDLTTTFYASEYMFRHSGIDPARIELKTYEAGHMMYLHQPSFEKLSQDLRAFVAPPSSAGQEARVEGVCSRRESAVRHRRGRSFDLVHFMI